MTDTQRVADARQVALNAFNALWQPGPKQRTQSRQKALYWLSIAMRTPGTVPDFECMTLDQCKEIAGLCRRAHAPTTVSLRS